MKEEITTCELHNHGWSKEMENVYLRHYSRHSNMRDMRPKEKVEKAVKFADHLNDRCTSHNHTNYICPILPTTNAPTVTQMTNAHCTITQMTEAQRKIDICPIVPTTNASSIIRMTEPHCTITQMTDAYCSIIQMIRCINIRMTDAQFFIQMNKQRLSIVELDKAKSGMK